MRALKDLLAGSPPEMNTASPGMDSLGECPACGRLLEFDRHGELVPHGCCLCADAGFVRTRALPGEPEFGRAVVCSCQDAPKLAGAIPPVNLEVFGVPWALREATLASWQPPNHRARIAAQNMTVSWPPSKPILVLWGEPGRGKSHLAAGVIRAVWEKHRVRGWYQSVPELVARLRATFEPSAQETQTQVEQYLCAVPLLVLDDLGKERQTEFARETIYRVVNSRYGRALPTIVTCNPVEWDALDRAVKSRLMDSRLAEIVECTGIDHRSGRAKGGAA